MSITISTANQYAQQAHRVWVAKPGSVSRTSFATRAAALTFKMLGCLAACFLTAQTGFCSGTFVNSGVSGGQVVYDSQNQPSSIKPYSDGTNYYSGPTAFSSTSLPIGGSALAQADAPGDTLSAAASAPPLASTGDCPWFCQPGNASADASYSDMIYLYGSFQPNLGWIALRGSLDATLAPAFQCCGAYTRGIFRLDAPGSSPGIDYEPVNVAINLHWDFDTRIDVTGSTTSEILFNLGETVGVSAANSGTAVFNLVPVTEIIVPRGNTVTFATSDLGLQPVVKYVNIAPSFNNAGDVTVPRDSGAQLISGWASSISAGPPDEADQTLTFIVTANSNPVLFAAGPAISPDGTLSFTPAPGVSGSAQITVVLQDNGGTILGGVDTSAPSTFTITVAPANTPPTANDQSVTTPEGTPVSITLTGSDPDNNPLTFTVASNPSHGTLSGTTPDLTYTPDPSYSGPDSFTFTANDGTVDSPPATVSITVTPVNNPPVANDDSYTTDEKSALNVISPGLLGNDTDVDEGGLPRFDFAGWVWPADNDPDFIYGQRFSGSYQVDPAAPFYAATDGTLQLEYVCQNAQWEIRFTDAGYLFQGGSTLVDVGNNTSFGDRYIVTFYNGGSVGTPLPSGRVFSIAQIDLFDPLSSGADMLSDDSIQTTTVPLALAQNKGGRFLFQDNSQPSLIIDQLVGPKAVTAVSGDTNAVGNSVRLPSGAKLQVNANGSFSYDPSGRFAYLANGATATDTFTYEMSDRTGAKSSATVTITITGVNDPPVLASPVLAQTATYGVPFTFALPAATFTDPDSGQSLSYSASSLPAGITFDPATRTFQGTPTAAGNFTVSLVATDNGSPALSATTSFGISVNQANLSVSADSFTRPYGQANPTFTGTILGVVNGDNITASYTTTATDSSPTGSYPISPALNDPGNRLANYSVTTANGTLTITSASQTITFPQIHDHTYGNVAFALNASASSGLPVTFTSLTPSVATVSGNTVTIVAAGTATIRASQAGDGNYLAAANVDQTFTVAQAGQTITFASIPGRTYGDPAFPLSASASSGLPVTFTSLTPSVATVSGSTVTIVGAGTATIRASQAGNGNYLAAANADETFIVAQAIQTMTIAPISDHTYGDAVFGLTASTSSGLPVTFTSLTPAVATVSGNMVTLVGAGTATIRIFQAGNGNYLATANVDQTFNVAQANQAITFAPIPGHTYGDAAFALSASASSGLPVTFTSLSPAVATVSGNTVTIVGASTVTLRASQAGNGNYHAAANVDQTFAVAKANQTITFSLPSASSYGADVPLNGSASSGLAVSYTVSGPATLNGNLLHLTGVGTATVTASQGGNANFNPATSVIASISVTKAVLRVTADSKSKVYGQADPALTASYSGFVNGDTAAVLKGSPKLSTTATTSSTVGAYSITVTQGTLTAANYIFAFANGTMSVTTAGTTVTAASVTGKFGAASVALTASVAAISPSTATVNQGAVAFVVRNSGGVVVGQTVTGAVSKGTASASFPTSTLARGTYSISVTYGDGLATPNFSNAVGATTGTLTIK